MSKDELKQCPYCGNLQEIYAGRCKYCDSSLDERGLVVQNIREEDEDDEEVIRVTATIDDLQCPGCKAPIEEGTRVCGNCKTIITWKDGEPRPGPGFVFRQTGCVLTSLGCMFPLLIFVLFFVYLLSAGC